MQVDCAQGTKRSKGKKDDGIYHIEKAKKKEKETGGGKVHCTRLL